MFWTSIKPFADGIRLPSWHGSFVAIFALLLFVGPVVAGDADGDGVEDSLDNCLTEPNAVQRDTDGDGFGNVCDPDFDQNGAVDFLDLGALRGGDGTADANLDLDGSGVVDAADLNLLQSRFFGAPGPQCSATGDALADLNCELLARLRRRAKQGCDPLAPESPCRNGFLPPLNWDASLAATMATEVDSCPMFGAESGAVTFLLPQGTDESTLVALAFSKWENDSENYDPVTGTVTSGDGTGYRTLVAGTATRFGCAARTDCAGGPTGTFSILRCFIEPIVASGPAYPPAQ